MSGKFTFAVDRAWPGPHFHDRFLRAGRRLRLLRREAHDALGLPPNQHLTLNDMRGMVVQQQEVVDAFGRGLAVREEMAFHVGIVMDSSLARSQLARALAAAPGVRVFRDVAAAETWLLAEKEVDGDMVRQPAEVR